MRLSWLEWLLARVVTSRSAAPEVLRYNILAARSVTSHQICFLRCTDKLGYPEALRYSMLSG